jgi:hypothetical protein
MSKVYKHNTTWRTAELNKDWWYEVKHSEGNFHFVHPRLIEGCSDREEVVQKDWVDQARDFFWRKWPTWQDEKDFREAIALHAPKVKKFTRADLKGMMPYISTQDRITVIDFLKENWLLEE